MTTTEMTTAQIAKELQALNGRDGRVLEHEGYVLIDDGSVVATYTQEESGKLLQVWAHWAQQGVEDAYGHACEAASPTQDAELPAEILEYFKAWLGLDEDRKLNTWL